MKDIPLMYCMIVVSILVAGFFGLVNCWIIERKVKPIIKLEILVEYKDVVVFDSKRKLPIVFSTE